MRAFLIASLILALIPGPAVIFLIAQSLTHGRRAGLASIGGIALGNLGNAAVASVGLAAVLAASASAFGIIKLFGAAYLIFLGVRALRGRSGAAEAPGVVGVEKPVSPPPRLLPRHLFRDGFLVALLNPKTALFFAALLPQFLDPQAPPLGQSLLYGSIFVAIAMCTDTLYVLCASALAGALRHRSSWRPYGRYLAAASFIGLGIYAAIASPRASK
jgi:threonine/homoserine/homoserine lactone efflux protein